MYNKNYQNIKITPILSIVISIIIMIIMSITVGRPSFVDGRIKNFGLDIANNGTHIVEYYYINK